jgi:malonyl-CoA O-methyltransferase
MSLAQSISPAAVRAARDRLARGPAPFLWQEAARRMAERLPLLRLQPRLVLDMGCAWGDGLGLLRQHYPQARLLGVEASTRLAEHARRGHVSGAWLRRLRGAPPTEVVVGELGAAPPGGRGLAQLLWSNLALGWAGDPEQVFGAWSRLLMPDGVLMFTTFGPDTLRELRDDDAAALGVRPAAWVDMHDLGDLLVAQGLTAPVMDMELLRLRWADADSALRELAQLGRAPHELAFPGLRTPRRWSRLRELLRERAQAAAHGQVELSFELVYGHAFKPTTSRAEQGVASIGLEQIGGRRRAATG